MLIDGKQISKNVLQEVTSEAAIIYKNLKRKPGLNIILVGNNPASETYVRSKLKVCESVGINGILTRFDSSVSFVSPTTTIYGQYRTLILEDENSSFVWGDSNTGSADNDFYVISIERARYKQSLLPGTLNLVLSSSNDFTTNTPFISLNNTEELATSCLCLPIHTEIENSSQKYIIDNVLNFFK